jgi:hypothetical protein
LSNVHLHVGEPVVGEIDLLLIGNGLEDLGPTPP